MGADRSERGYESYDQRFVIMAHTAASDRDSIMAQPPTPRNPASPCAHDDGTHRRRRRRWHKQSRDKHCTDRNDDRDRENDHRGHQQTRRHTGHHHRRQRKHDQRIQRYQREQRIQQDHDQDSDDRRHQQEAAEQLPVATSLVPAAFASSPSPPSPPLPPAGHTAQQQHPPRQGGMLLARTVRRLCRLVAAPRPRLIRSASAQVSVPLARRAASFFGRAQTAPAAGQAASSGWFRTSRRRKLDWDNMTWRVLQSPPTSPGNGSLSDPTCLLRTSQQSDPCHQHQQQWQTRRASTRSNASQFSHFAIAEVVFPPITTSTLLQRRRQISVHSV